MVLGELQRSCGAQSETPLMGGRSGSLYVLAVLTYRVEKVQVQYYGQG